MDEALLQILCCPVSRQRLHVATTDDLARARKLSASAPAAGLLREDGQVLYPVYDGIPALLPEEGIALHD